MDVSVLTPEIACVCIPVYKTVFSITETGAQMIEGFESVLQGYRDKGTLVIWVGVTAYREKGFDLSDPETKNFDAVMKALHEVKQVYADPLIPGDLVILGAATTDESASQFYQKQLRNAINYKFSARLSGRVLDWENSVFLCNAPEHEEYAAAAGLTAQWIRDAGEITE